MIKHYIFHRALSFFIPLLLANAMHGQGISIGNYNVYYGHIHNHTRYSDGSGLPDQAYRYARDVAGLDFFGLSDHALLLDETEYLSTISVANYHNEDGKFVTFYGFEWTSSNFGHVSIINSKEFCSSRHTETSTFQQLIAWIDKHECIAFLNHPGRQDWAGEEFGHFTDFPHDKFVGMELWNKTIGFSRYYYNDGYYRNDEERGYYEEAVFRGWKIGAAGSEDNHSASWGTNCDYRTAVLADTLTRDAIYNAMKARRFFSTEDKNISISFTLNESEMGSTIKAKETQLQLLANDGNGEIFTMVTLYKNGVQYKSWEVNSARIEIQDTLITKSGENYYIRVTQNDKDEAVTSPIWIQGTEIQNIPPRVNIIYPQNNETIQAGKATTLAAEANDSDGKIKEILYYSNSSLIGKSYGLIHMLNFMPEEGTNNLYAIAIDNNSDSAFSDTITIIGKQTMPTQKGPQIKILSPKNENIFYLDSTFNITGFASGIDTNSQKIRLFVNNNQVEYSKNQLFSANYKAQDNIIEIIATIIDNKGNILLSDSVTCNAIKRQISPPIVYVSVTDKLKNDKKEVSIEVTIENVTGTISLVEIYGDESCIGSFTKAPYILNYRLRDSSEKIKAIAYYNLSSTATSAAITIDNQKTVIKKKSNSILFSTYPTILQKGSDLTIELSNIESANVSIVNEQGQTIFSTQLHNKISHITPPSLATGNYFIILEHKDLKDYKVISVL